MAEVATGPLAGLVAGQRAGLGPVTAPPSSLVPGQLQGLPLAEAWFGLVFVVLGLFLLLDGFDFGVGVVFALRPDATEREQLLAAIGPLWDGNEVWLVVFGGTLFAVFPSAYAALFGRYYLLMFGILAALALRGLSPELYERREDDRWRRAWGTAFVVGSVASPFLLGLFVTDWLVGSPGFVTLPGALGGLAVLSLATLDGAAFLGLKTRGPLREAARRYGVRAAGAFLVLVVLTLGAVYLVGDARLRSAFPTPVVVGLVIATVLLVGGYVVALRGRRYRAAFAATAGLVFAFVGVVAALLYPFVDRFTGLTVSTAVVGPVALGLLSLLATLLVPLALLYFAVLYSAFAGPVEAGEGY